MRINDLHGFANKYVSRERHHVTPNFQQQHVARLCIGRISLELGHEWAAIYIHPQVRLLSFKCIQKLVCSTSMPFLTVTDMGKRAPGYTTRHGVTRSDAILKAAELEQQSCPSFYQKMPIALYEELCLRLWVPFKMNRNVRMICMVVLFPRLTDWTTAAGWLCTKMFRSHSRNW